MPSGTRHLWRTIVNQVLKGIDRPNSKAWYKGTADLADLDTRREQSNPTKSSDHGSPGTSTSIGVGNSGTMQYVHWVQSFPDWSDNVTEPVMSCETHRHPLIARWTIG